MAHPNEDLLRKGYAAFGEGDLDTVMGLFADDIKWHVPGRNPLAGDYSGKEEVGAFLGRAMELTNGTFRVDVHDVLANDDHGVALVHSTAERDGKSLDSNDVHVWHIRDGRATEQWIHPGDQYAADDFWS
jgi:ketosteroid isomerase-like protein